MVTEYFPAAQSVQDEAEDAAKVPGGHVEQTVSPSALLNVPAAQLIQMEVPVLEYFPTLHKVHTEAPGMENLPETHWMQTVFDDPPKTVENLAAAQFIQSLAPLVVEYLPARQSKQVLAVVAMMVVENMPALHSLQTVAAVISMYFPAGHFMQDSAAKAFM